MVGRIKSAVGPGKIHRVGYGLEVNMKMTKEMWDSISPERKKDIAESFAQALLEHGEIRTDYRNDYLGTQYSISFPRHWSYEWIDMDDDSFVIPAPEIPEEM